MRELEESEHLEAHLLGLLGLHGSHVLVVSQGVPLLLLLCTQVAPQGQQDTLWLWEGGRLPRTTPALSNLCPLPSAPTAPTPEADLPAVLPGNLPRQPGVGR